jgi:hypothetical protein
MTIYIIRLSDNDDGWSIMYNDNTGETMRVMSVTGVKMDLLHPLFLSSSGGISNRYVVNDLKFVDDIYAMYKIWEDNGSIPDGIEETSGTYILNFVFGSGFTPNMMIFSPDECTEILTHIDTTRAWNR